MYTHHSAIVPRIAPAAGLAATTVMSVLLPSATVSEAADTQARLEVVIHQVTIHDDNEGIFSGKGEMDLWIDLWRCPAWAPLLCEDFDTTGFVSHDHAHF